MGEVIGSGMDGRASSIGRGIGMTVCTFTKGIGYRYCRSRRRDK